MGFAFGFLLIACLSRPNEAGLFYMAIKMNDVAAVYIVYFGYQQ
jgi:hypothetical protein